MSKQVSNPLPPGIYMASEVHGPLAFGAAQVPRVEETSLPEYIGTHCFICDAPLTLLRPSPQQRTREDVMPNWLRRAFEMPNTESGINLPDGTPGPAYEDVLVPCCATCNNVAMSAVENRVASAWRQGFHAFTQLSRSDIFLWTAKIVYGILYRQTNPWNFKTNAASTPTRTEAAFEHFLLTRTLLKGFIKPVVVDAPASPFSILCFPLLTGSEPKLNFNFRDSPGWPLAIALRMGPVGVIVSFEDCGMLEHWYDTNLKSIVGGHALHPLQFAELVARAFYYGGLYGLNFSYTQLDSDTALYLGLRPIPAEGYARSPEREAAMVAHYTGIAELGELGKTGPGVSPTLLVSSDGRFVDMQIEEGVLYPL